MKPLLFSVGLGLAVALLAELPPLIPGAPVNWPTVVIYGIILVGYWLRQRQVDQRLRKHIKKLRADLKEAQAELIEARQQREEMRENLTITSTIVDTVTQAPNELDAVLKRLPPRKPDSAGCSSSGITTFQGRL